MSTEARTVAFPYQDRGLDIDQRVEDLLSRLELADKAGLLFHQATMTIPPSARNEMFQMPTLESMILNRRMNHFNVIGSVASGREFAAWHNSVQDVAARTPLGIPVTLSTDPRHAFTDNPGAAMMAGPFAQWPESLGLAALSDPERVYTFASNARAEYLAVGLRVALHPQIDLATDPRWGRTSGTFGEDAGLTSRLVAAYIRGFQGDTLGTSSVSTMVKHFPGGGPQKDGEDPHFPYGREQVYPGGMFEYHLEPFRAAIAAGGSQMMPYYGMPVGTEYEEVGFGFNKGILTDLLRNTLGFEGIICTDWGLLTDTTLFGEPLLARAWGVENLTRAERMLKSLEAGVDQFGGELCTEELIGLVTSGAVSEARLDTSIRRILREKFVLGLFDNPYVDQEHAEIVVGNAEFREAGMAAQRDSLTLLTNKLAANGRPTLPLARATRIYAEGVDAATASEYGVLVERPADADVAILRIKTPWEQRTHGMEVFFHAGSLDFPEAELERITAIAAEVPTVIDIYLDRPAILTGLVESAAAIIANYGASDAALFAVLFGDHSPKGRLPFDLPRSMAAVEASREDVPFDTENPVFAFGHGLSY